MQKAMSYRPLPAITESADELRQLIGQTRQSEARERLQMLLLIQTGELSTRRALAERLMRHRNTISRWLDTYQAGGIKHLLRRDLGGRPPGQRTLPEPVFEALKARLASDEGFASYVEVQRWLYEDFGLQVPYKTVHQIVRYSLKAKLKRPRPVHPKKA